MTRDQIPLPNVSLPLTAPYWKAARERRLVMQKCAGCGQLRWPPKPLCPNCLHPGTERDWVDIPKGGWIWSFAIYHRAFHKGFADALPYNVIYGKLDAGPMVISNVVGTNDLRIGQRIEAFFDDITDEITLVKFKLVP